MRWLGVGVLVAFMGLAVLFFSRLGEDPAYLPSARLHQPLPAFELPLLENPLEQLDRDALLAKFAGEYFLLNVWATWCPTCYIEHGALLELARQGVHIVGVNYKDDPVKALEYLQQKENPYQLVLLDQKGNFGLDLGVYGAPETYLVGREGKILVRHAGEMNAEVWEQLFLPAMGPEGEQP